MFVLHFNRITSLDFLDSQSFISEYGQSLKSVAVGTLVNELQHIEYTNVEGMPLTVCGFHDQFKLIFTICGEIFRENKRTITSYVFSSSLTEMCLTLRVLRLLAREVEGLQPLLESSAIRRVMELATLCPFSGASSSSTATTTDAVSISPTSISVPVLEEALKCLVNMTLRHENVRLVFLAHEGALGLINLLRRHVVNNTASPNANLLFALMRLAVTLTTPFKERVNPVISALLTHGALPLVIDLLQRTLHNASALFTTQTCPLYLPEILKLLFNLTFDLGPLGSGTCDPHATYLSTYLS